MLLNWYKLAQEQQSFGFYNDPKYQGENPRDSSFHREWAKTKGLSPELLKSLMEDVELNNIYEVKMLLNQYGFSWKELTLKKHTLIIVGFSGQYGSSNNYVIDEFFDISSAKEWLSNICDHNLFDYVDYADFNQEFWDGITKDYKLYHATDPTNKDSILKNGIEPRDELRGINNRSMGPSVFTTDDPDSVIDSFGPLVFEINVGQMKKDGYMPMVTMEEPFEDIKARESLASYLGIEDYDFSSEYASEGLYESTIAFYGGIPPKYLRVYQE